MSAPVAYIGTEAGGGGLPLMVSADQRAAICQWGAGCFGDISGTWECLILYVLFARGIAHTTLGAPCHARLAGCYVETATKQAKFEMGETMRVV